MAMLLQLPAFCLFHKLLYNSRRELARVRVLCYNDNDEAPSKRR
jgi:hypothetical protein